MNEEKERRKKRNAPEYRAYELASLRIAELFDNPITGKFDLEHLKAIHVHIFQDSPEHRPGVIRSDSRDWIKTRALEEGRTHYRVYYAHRNIEAEIAKILERFSAGDFLSGLSRDAAAARLAVLYGDLDRAHGFYEGNSRTLREFTRELALAAGHTLDWVKTGVGARERDALYVARDLTVLERAYPGLTEEKAMRTRNRAEYEAYFVLEELRKSVGVKTLEAIIRDGLDAQVGVVDT